MISFNVMTSFLRAAQEDEIENFNDADTEQGQAGSGDFLTPSVEQGVPAPYNYNFI